MDQSLATLLHLLVFAYWLGGDLGAFVASFILTDTTQSQSTRLTAARLLNHVDMAPRTALILTAPTGLSLAIARGWLALDAWIIAAVWLVAALWLAHLWYHHLANRAVWRHLDLMLRLALIAALLLSIGLVEPGFLKAKLVLLATCVIAGLFIRRTIAPLGPALAQLAAGNTTQADPAITSSLRRARPLVIAIWLALVAAAFLGVVRPA